jgi:hypothetical protein
LTAALSCSAVGASVQGTELAIRIPAAICMSASGMVMSPAGDRDVHRRDDVHDH